MSVDSKIRSEDSTPIDEEHEISIEIEGPGINPSTVDSVWLLELAASYFSLVKLIAKDADDNVSLTGIRVIEKCAAIVARTENAKQYIPYLVAASDQVSGHDTVVMGGNSAVERAQSILRLFPEGVRAAARCGGSFTARLTAPETQELTYDTILSIRATPVRVGGKSPLVRFHSEIEAPFTLHTTRETARELGALLYKEVQIEALVSRDAQKKIIAGKLNAFFKLDEADSMTAWAQWLQSGMVEAWK